MTALLSLMESFCVGVAHRRDRAPMTCYPGIPDAGSLPSAYWSGYMLTDWFEFEGRAVNAQGYTFDEIRASAENLGIDWVSHIVHGGDDGRAFAAKAGEVFADADTLDYRAMLACKRATDYLSPAHRVSAELAFDLGPLDAANAIIDDCERAMNQHEGRT